MQRPSRTLAIVAATLAAATSARAYEYCVTCIGPDAIYACSIEGAGADAPRSSREQIACISTLAALGKHEACAVDRNAAPPCTGEARIVAAPADLAPGSAAAGEVPSPQSGGESAAAPPADQPTLDAEAPSEAPPPAREVPADAQGAIPEPASAEPAPEPAAQKPKKPPKTMEELAKRTVQSSKEGLDKAGDAIADGAKNAGDGIKDAGSTVGRAAKKTWDCLASLFSDC